PFITNLPPWDRTGHGVLGRNVNRTFADILDGTSNTLLLVEDGGRNQHWKMGQYVGQGEWPGPESGAWANPFLGASIDWLKGFNPVTNTLVGPCVVNCINAGEIYSFHPGGANTLFADGAVHFLKAGTDINIVAALLTRNNGEVLANTDLAY